MKRVTALFVVIVLLIGLIPSAFGDSQDSYVKVSIDNTYLNTPVVNVLFNGEEIESDIPSIIYNDRTLVPIRFVANCFGADVEWNQQNKEASIKLPDKEIVLTVDSPIAEINGVKQNIPYDVPAKLVNDSRTMVPLRFVSEIFGCTVAWDQSTRTGIIETIEKEVTGISIHEDNGQSAKIVVNTTSEVEYSTMYLQDPYRLVVDIHDSSLNIEDDSILDSKGIVNIKGSSYPIENVRASQFSNTPETTRLVIELEELMGYDISTSEDGHTLSIVFTNTVKDIEMKKINKREGIVIDNLVIPQYNILRLTNPDRIVVDLLNSTLEKSNDSYDIRTDFIKGIRVAQFEPDSLYSQEDKIVRVVLDVDETADTPNLMIKNDDNKLIIYADDEGFENITYQNYEDNGGFISIEADKNADFKTKYDEVNKVVEIIVDEDDVELDNGVLIIKDNNIDTITVEDDGSDKKILVKLSSDIEISMDSNSPDITFTSVKSKYSDKLIVVDAGHGGYDPGAIGPITKVKEKDLNLQVALKVNQKLKELGFKTIMTRETDVFVDLYERADIANRNNADFFISVHHNSIDNKNIAGIQTLYCPSYYSPYEQADNYPAAEAIHDALLAGANSSDKGIIRRSDLVVVRETAMPAALAELGFLTNPTEEKKVATEEYQNKVAEAIANGIVKYFEEN